ncbi:UNVERIFIED_CONTAM: putative mitochondrial protein [Sesamum latifolium]|uniref:Mitochondrial protein n=1 Tax=Sesamum latifolium TaxID=2727402 RepID=A0AAW2VIA3_9LAMI
MSCFKLSDRFLNELESLIANFFWNSGTEFKIHWVAWTRLCTTKEAGGLGFRRLKEFNLALLAKQTWRVALGPSSVLNSVMSHKYFPHNSFFDSSRWTALEGWGWHFDSDNGTSLDPETRFFSVDVSPASLPQDSCVAALLTDAKAWDAELIKAEFCPLDADSILDIKLQDGECDSLVWHFEKQRQFSVQSAYNVALRLGKEAECLVNAQSWDFIWWSKALPRVILFAWRCALDALPTTTCLRSCGILLADGCGWCRSETEEVLHVLFHCILARLVWAISDLTRRSVDCAQSCTESWFREVHRKLGQGDWNLFLTVCWSIWKARNLRLFEGLPLDAEDIILQARRFIGSTWPIPRMARSGSLELSL